MADNQKPKGTGGGWSNEQLLNCLLQAIVHSETKIDYSKITYPPGRNASGFKQKISAIKRSMKEELGASDQPAAESTAAKKTGGRKRKNDDADGQDKGAKKQRGRPKKNVDEPEVKMEPMIKNEPDGELEQEA